MSLGFLTAHAWMHADGQHVVIRHECLGETEEHTAPWPTWRASGDGFVEPSYNCGLCGLHAFIWIGPPPIAEAEWA